MSERTIAPLGWICGKCGTCLAYGEGCRTCCEEARKQEVWPTLLQMMEERVAQGKAHYGVPLSAHNGRDALLDAWQEAADLLFYLTQCLKERDA